MLAISILLWIYWPPNSPSCNGDERNQDFDLSMFWGPTSATSWTIAHQNSLSMEFSRQEYWSGQPFPSPGDQPRDWTGGLCIAGRIFTAWTTREAYGKMMLWKCCTQYASKFGKLSSGHRTGKGQFSFQSQRKAMPKPAQTTAQLHASHMLVK